MIRAVTPSYQRRPSELTRHTLRSVRWASLGAGWAIAIAVAAVAHIDSEVELMLVTLASTIGLGSATADPVAMFTDSTPERRRRRRVRALAPGLLGSFAVWLAVVGVTAAVAEATPAPGRWAIGAWFAVSASQVAVGGVLSARDGGDPGFTASALVALAWLSPFFVPHMHQWIYPVGAHGGRWLAVAAAAVALTTWSWRDPSARPRPRRLP